MASPAAIRKAIRESELDNDDLDTIFEALQDKRQQLARMLLGSLRVGDRVQITNVKPKYLTDAIGEVEAITGQKIEILLDEGQYTGRYGRKVTVRPGMLRIIA